MKYKETFPSESKVVSNTFYLSDAPGPIRSWDGIAEVHHTRKVRVLRVL